MAFLSTPDLRKLQDMVMAGDEISRAIAIGILTKAADGIADASLREQAFDRYATDEIEIDDEPATSPANNGTWVAAWVWIEQPDSDACATCRDAIEARLLPCDECGAQDEDE
ncbi:hypothetical protein [Sphingomonas sp. NFR15]|uniref:hypothetical protein n=1 Tax=Sphingomonas sp. NFR15 TaxID=1566282 RepID=UPI0008859088|nr:hypothetical protein [Sphingomonas sp. NFR15]SDA14773.1 hypothetical protein SAMN03159340_00592 [Sphingomonas sp. NFR15]